MEEDAGERRPKRRCAANKSAVPSAVHYVGYVEDDETPEMIMKKFEELDKVVAASTVPKPGPAGETAEDTAELQADAGTAAQVEEQLAGLTDAQLMEVFKQTSIFNVRSALAGNEALMGGDQVDEGFDRSWSDDDGGGSEDEDLWNDVRGFWSDDEDEAQQWRKGRRGKGRDPSGTRVRGMSHAKARLDVVTHYNATTQALIRRKVRVVDKDALLHIKVPNPLPLSWGRIVQPYVPPELSYSQQLDADDQNAGTIAAQPATEYVEEANGLCADFGALRRDYQGVLINQGWEAHATSDAAAFANLARIPLPRLCPVGFIFIWAEKHHISGVVKQMYKWGYIYIENLTWVIMHANNSIMRLPSAYAQRSHLTLFLFRKEGGGKDIELRHQRNPDVIFDCIRASPGQVFDLPKEVYVAIETLLPTGKGKFLELWARQGVQRPGWTQVVSKQDKAASLRLS